MGENFLAPVPTAVYGGTLLMPAIAYYLLQKAIMRKQGPDSVLANALGKDIKGKISPILYLAGIVLASKIGGQIEKILIALVTTLVAVTAALGSEKARQGHHLRW